jgi:hypothetical protein
MKITLQSKTVEKAARVLLAYQKENLKNLNNKGDYHAHMKMILHKSLILDNIQWAENIILACELMKLDEAPYYKEIELTEEEAARLYQYAIHS